MAALFHTGLYTAHDMWHQVARLYHYTQALKDGQLPPTWISQLAMGHGYPLFFFSYHLPWIFGAPLVLLGASIEFTIKYLFFFSVVASGFAMYMLGLHLFKNRWAATIAAGTYIWAPYHFLTVFVSAAIGTAFQFALVPLLFLGITLVCRKQPRTGMLLLGGSIAASILAHALTFIFIMPFMALFAVVLILGEPNNVRLRKLLLLATAGLLGLLLSAFYLVPFISLSSAIIAGNQGNGFTDIYKSNFATLSQLLYSPWGFGPIVSNAKDGEISLQIGIVQWLGILSTLLLGLASLLGRFWPKVRALSSTLPLSAWTMVGLFSLSVLGMLDSSQPAWDAVTKFISLDYPFRLLLLAVFFGSLSIGFVVSALQIPWMRALFGVFVLVLALYTNRNHVRVNMYTYVPLSLYIESETTTNTFHEYLPRKADSSLLKDGTAPVIAVPSGLSASNVVRNTIQTSFSVSLPEESTIALADFDFPGQQVYVDGGFVSHSVDGAGRIQLSVPAGTHQIVRVHEQTAAQQTGIILTVFGLLLTTKLAFMDARKQ